MKGKYMKVRRVAIPALTLAMMLSQSGAAFAIDSRDLASLAATSPVITVEVMSDEAKEAGLIPYAVNDVVFTDLAGFDWAKPAIENMAAQGILSGVGNQKYAPAANVTVTEFASMAMRAYGGKDVAITLSKEQGNLEEIEAVNGNYWGNTTICAAQKFGLTDRFGLDKGRWSEPATRAEMATIVMTIAEQMGDEAFEIKDGIENNIGDYMEVASYANDMRYILQAYSNGILCGTDDAGSYAPSAYAKRAEAAAIMQRLVDPSKRLEVEIKPAPVLPVPDEDNVMEDGTVYPKEGDIGPNGQPITRDPVTGVLGFGNGQKGGIYIGIKYPTNGATIQVGSTAADHYDNMGGTYREKNGYIFWEDEWSLINNTAIDKLNREHPATSVGAGAKADIYGNIVSKGSPDAMYEVSSAFGSLFWEPIKF